MNYSFSTKETILLRALFEYQLAYSLSIDLTPRYYDIAAIFNQHSIYYDDEEIKLIFNKLFHSRLIEIDPETKYPDESSSRIIVRLSQHGNVIVRDELKKSVDRSFTSSEVSDLDERLTILCEEIKKSNHGQQIIYDDLIEEIQGLKRLVDKLSKKDWVSLLKGKLIEQGLGEISKKGFDAIIKAFGNELLTQ